MSKLTLDEAIKHCLEVAEQNETQADKIGRQLIGSAIDKYTTDCRECAAEHRQLVEWLMEYKDLKAEQNDQKEAKRLLKLAVEDLERLAAEQICFSGCDERCPFDCKGRLEEKHWKYLDEALKLIKED